MNQMTLGSCCLASDASHGHIAANFRRVAFNRRFQHRYRCSIADNGMNAGENHTSLPVPVAAAINIGWYRYWYPQRYDMFSDMFVH